MLFRNVLETMNERYGYLIGTLVRLVESPERAMAAAILKPGGEQDGSSSGIAGKMRKMSFASSKTSMATEDCSGGEPKSPVAMLRRRSTFKSIATGLLGMRRLTLHTLKAVEETKPKVKLENTYKTEPDQGTVFKSKNVEKFVENILEEKLRNEKYNRERCKDLTCDLSVLIKNRVKKMGFPRYKIICNVVIGQCMEQGVEMASQSIWSPSTDNFSCSSYRNGSLFAVALVHGVYYE